MFKLIKLPIVTTFIISQTTTTICHLLSLTWSVTTCPSLNNFVSYKYYHLMMCCRLGFFFFLKQSSLEARNTENDCVEFQIANFTCDLLHLSYFFKNETRLDAKNMYVLISCPLKKKAKVWICAKSIIISCC